MSKKIDNTIIFKFKNDLKKSSKFIKRPAYFNGC